MNELKTAIATEQIGRRHFYFAGGGTGGHIYPAIALAHQLKTIKPDCEITFFCSRRDIDARILSKESFEFMPLSAKGFGLRPDRFVNFLATQMQSREFALQILRPLASTSVVIGIGGFASVPVMLAAKKLKIPSVLLNTDYVPGKANRFVARWAQEIYTQFEATADYFGRRREHVRAVGCPLREGFSHARKLDALEMLKLNTNKSTLVVTGASSGAVSVNEAVCRNLETLHEFADSWQIVHLTGLANHAEVQLRYEGTAIDHRVVDYYDDMPSLLAAADLVIGRGGAVSVAEYAAAGVAAIILPYPYHKDRHQYLNAKALVEAGAAVLVDDLPSRPQTTAENIQQVLKQLMSDRHKLKEMARQATGVAKPNAANAIAERLITMAR